MAKTYSPPMAQTATIGIATLTTATAITSRANITGTTGLVQLTPVFTEDKRLDLVTIKAKAISVAGLISIWMYNGTTSFIWDEIPCTAITASTTTASDFNQRFYQNVTIPINSQLFISETVQQDYTVFAFGPNY